MDMLVEQPVNPRDVYAAGYAADFVKEALQELAAMEEELPALIRMDWYSPAAREFTDLLRGYFKNVSLTLTDLRTCASAVERHVEELRSQGCEVP